ncbi:MAG: AAA-type ATPase lid domain-containing protein [Planctomycetota bacterium]
MNVVRIELPPLKERREDIPLLVEHFMKKFAGEMKTRKKKLAPETMEILIADDWPGNVRELENRLRRAVAMAEGDTILPEHIKGGAKTETKPGYEKTALKPNETLKEARDRIEKDLILNTLNETDFNFSKAAKRLGMARTWLHRRAKQLGISRK